jgi:hypothetical protein
VGAVEPSTGGANRAWEDEAGTTHISRSRGGESKPPTYSPQAMGLLKGEFRRLRAGERTLLGKLASIVDGERQAERDRWAA